MGFSELERIKIAEKALAASVINADPRSVWYEALTQNEFVLEGARVWTGSDKTALLANPAASVAAAQALEAGVLSGIIADNYVTATRLTAVPGINNTWVALNTYNDFSSGRIKNWIQPQFVPQSTGQPSVGYFAELWEGDPGGGGSLIGPTDGTTGTGINKSVGWIWNYAGGILLLSDDFTASVTDPYLKGFRYIGETVDDIAAAITGTRRYSVPLAGVVDNSNRTFTTPDDFVHVVGGNSIQLMHNGRVLSQTGTELPSDGEYYPFESGGTGTGYDSIRIVGFRPRQNGSTLRANYTIA